MVRFSCFQTNIHSPRRKKEVVQQSLESMSKAFQDRAQGQEPKACGAPSSFDSLKAFPNNASSTTILDQGTSSPSPENCCTSEGTLGNSSPEVQTKISQHWKDPEIEPHDHYEKNLGFESFHGNELGDSDSFLSSEDGRQLEEGREGLPYHLHSEHADDSGQSTHGTPPMIAKSYSVPDLGMFSPTSKEGSPSAEHVLPRCRSSEDLDALDEIREEVQNDEVCFHAMEDQQRDCSIFESINNRCEHPSVDGYESYNWAVSGMDEVDMMKNPDKDSTRTCDVLPSKDFKTKRIEDWVNMIDLEDSSPLKDPCEPCLSTEKLKKVSNPSVNVSSAKLDPKSTHGMEAAKKYVSSLTATSTSAQMPNLGLVVIPFLSAFVSLKVLNLSSNSIVRITAGALPRGLHALNLAKNNISTIEGLRELTRLRVLDLSYNRILRIGHGLASCSSLKELYLAGNKISEVEGLHRLLKLNILDLRFNKISTAKCLGQLAANYSSLQAINLEGNPAQRNVGDEQLKKYLQGLLPHLIYFNKQPIKAISSKEAADRPARSVITSHQFDRSLRSDHKLNRKGNLGGSKASTSSSHAHRVQAVRSPNRSKDRHAGFPPAGTKASHHRHHFLDLGSKLLKLKTDLSLHRSHSEGNIGGP